MNAPSPYASFPIRLLAAFVDSLVLLPANAVLQTLDAFYMAVMSLIIAGAYHALFISGSWAATPGKRLLNIHVLRRDGQPLSQREALARFLAFTLPTLPLYSSLNPETAQSLVLFLVSVWFLPVLLTEQKTGLHDILCDTRVLRGRLN